jgi:hypothetical protein
MDILLVKGQNDGYSDLSEYRMAELRGGYSCLADDKVAGNLYKN